MLTKAHLNDDGSLKGSSNTKYVQIIKPHLDKLKSRSLQTGSGILSPDIKELKKKLYIILGNIELNHTNISHKDLETASEIIDILKSKNMITPIIYHNIFQLLAKKSNSFK